MFGKISQTLKAAVQEILGALRFFRQQSLVSGKPKVLGHRGHRWVMSSISPFLSIFEKKEISYNENGLTRDQR